MNSEEWADRKKKLQTAWNPHGRRPVTDKEHAYHSATVSIDHIPFAILWAKGAVRPLGKHVLGSAKLACFSLRRCFPKYEESQQSLPDDS